MWPPASLYGMPRLLRWAERGRRVSSVCVCVCLSVYLYVCVCTYVCICECLSARRGERRGDLLHMDVSLHVFFIMHPTSLGVCASTRARVRVRGYWARAHVCARRLGEVAAWQRAFDRGRQNGSQISRCGNWALLTLSFAVPGAAITARVFVTVCVCIHAVCLCACVCVLYVLTDASNQAHPHNLNIWLLCLTFPQQGWLWCMCLCSLPPPPLLPPSLPPSICAFHNVCVELTFYRSLRAGRHLSLCTPQ